MTKGHKLTAQYRRIKQTWDNQIKERKERVAEMLLQRVKDRSFSADGFETRVEAVANPFEDNLDDLDVARLRPSSTRRFSVGGASNNFEHARLPPASVDGSPATEDVQDNHEDALLPLLGMASSLGKESLNDGDGVLPPQLPTLTSFALEGGLGENESEAAGVPASPVKE